MWLRLSNPVNFLGLQANTSRAGGLPGCSPPHTQNRNIKNTDLLDIMISKVLCGFPFSRNQPLQSADDQYVRILKNKLIKLKETEDRTLWLSHGTCSYIRMYIHAVADSVMLCLQHDFYNIIFKIEHKLYTASWSTPHPPTPQGRILGAQPCVFVIFVHSSKSSAKYVPAALTFRNIQFAHTFN
jgi:hypothetical protein